MFVKPRLCIYIFRLVKDYLQVSPGAVLQTLQLATDEGENIGKDDPFTYSNSSEPSLKSLKLAIATADDFHVHSCVKKGHKHACRPSV